MEDVRRALDGKADWPNLHICIEAARSIITSRFAAAVLIRLQSLMYARMDCLLGDGREKPSCCYICRVDVDNGRIRTNDDGSDHGAALFGIWS
jgi:hypothetical protein